MLDYSKLKAPPAHGDVLIVPGSETLAQIARENNRALRRADRPLLGSTLATWRSRTRKAVAGTDEGLLIVTGHAPEFIHPGVWAKQIVAMRLARAASGKALNVVVDSDAPRSTALQVPTVGARGVEITAVPILRTSPGYAYEQVPAEPAARVSAIQQGVRDAMGDAYPRSQMPRFFAALGEGERARDWVDQLVVGRRAIEAGFDVRVEDHRVSRICTGPLLLDMLLNAEPFAESYNRALDEYRRRHRVRGAQRPIPDLAYTQQRCEVPLWIYRSDEPRRRLFVTRRDNQLVLFAGDVQSVSLPVNELRSSSGVEALASALAGWRIRPRALALTLWARLLLADLFIHGIGGAKYDRITDMIMADYYGVRPPRVACVTATLHMDLPRDDVTEDTIRRLAHDLRDFQYNPQRHLDAAPDIEPLLRQRADLVRRSDELRERRPEDRPARRDVFFKIREVNEALAERGREMRRARQNALAQARESRRHNKLSEWREYFFGLYDRETLQALLDALPGEEAFRV